MTERKRLPIVPILITIILTLVLSAGSFYGCARTYSMGGTSSPNEFFAWSFVVFAVAFLVSLIWLLVTIVVNFFRRNGERQ